MSARQKRVAIHACVSTRDQEPKTQLRELERYAKLRNFAITHRLVEYESGANTDRAELKRVMELARRREIDVVLVWRFDRFARSTQQLLTALQEFRQLNVDFISLTEQIDTTTATGELVLGSLL